MAQIFISHSSLDPDQASRLLDWLHTNGFAETFLDFDKHAGLAAGSDWERTLYREMAEAEAVILVLTSNWFESKWCFAEFTQARALGKAIFPLIESPVGETVVSADIQTLDLVKNREDALSRLLSALNELVLNSRGGFDWDQTRPPYPGLLALDQADAAIYFGRDNDVRRLIERLTARRVQGGAKMVAVLGASGSGKSSLIRAGVLPRLKRDKPNWIALPPFRPQVHPLDELAQSVGIALGPGADWRHWRDALMGQDLVRTLSGLAGDLRAANGQNEAQILISIDQAEEIFGTADKTEAAAFVRVLNAMQDPSVPFLVVVAMRSDYLGELQKAPGLTAAFEEFSLKPMALDRVRDIIEGPARVAGLTVDEDLITDAMNDAATDDALPLLAFALRELYDRFGQTKKLTLQAYLALGDPAAQLSPLENAVRSKADEVLATAKASPEDLDALRDAFVPAMVRVNPEGEYVRRPAQLEALPAKARPLLESLARARLLTIEGVGDASTVEVTHEALLRKWPLLRGWLDQEREFLIGIDQLGHYLSDWQKAPAAEKTDALLAGLQLTRARSWLATKPSQLSEDERTFIQASIARQDAEIARHERSRLRVLQAIMGACLVLLIIAAGAIWEWHSAQEQKITAESGNKAGVAERETGDGGDDALALATAIDAVELRQTQESEFALRTALDAPLEHFILHHHGEVRSAKFSPDGTRIVTASFDHTARVWDARSGQLLLTLTGHSDEVWDAAFSPDGKHIVTASSDKSAIVWDAATGEKSAILKGHKDVVETAAFSPDGSRIVTASDDTTACIWDAETGQVIEPLKGHSDKVNTAVFSPDGKRIVTASQDKTARVWDAATGKPLATLKHSGEVRDAEFSPDGARIATASADSTAVVWDAQSGRSLQTLKGHTNQVNTATFSPDGKLIATASNDHTARIWDSQSGALLFSLPGHADFVDQAVFSPDGKFVITSSWDRTARIWNAATGQLITSLMGHNSKLISAIFSPDGKHILTASSDQTARVWDATAGILLSTVSSGSNFVFHADLSPDLSRAVIVSADDTAQVKTDEMAAMMAPTAGHAANAADAAPAPDQNQIAAGAFYARVWNIQTGQAGATLKGHTALVAMAGFSPDGKRVVTTSFDGTARIWNADSGQWLLTLAGHKGTVWDAAFSPDGKRVVTAGADSTVRVWDANSGQPLQTLNGNKGMVLSAAFSPDGTRIVTANQDHSAQVWDVSSGKPLATMVGDSWIIYQARFSPDGKRVVTCSADNSVRVWDAATGKQQLILSGHTDDVMEAAFSPDGSRIVTASDDHAARLWDAVTGEPLGVLAGATDWVYTASFSPDGKNIVTASADGTARTYVADLPDLLKWAKAQLPVDSGQ
ncbi:MAG: TIR domain-containing protein [Terracidiphilus sp.]